MNAPLSFLHPLWPVLFEDNHLLVLYKPAGLLVQGDRSGDVCLLELGKRWLKQRYQKPGQVFLGLVHRLDRPVAGVILFARTSKAARRLSDQFRTGQVIKRYLAVVQGQPSRTSGQLQNHLERRLRASRVVAESTPTSQEARLKFEVLAHGPHGSLLQVEPETGRRHQIRLQLAHLGHPILGDMRYGASAPLTRKQIALLAYELSFIHPTQGKRLTLRSPIPHDWPWPGLADAQSACPWCWQDLQLDLI
jgi:23S rRNA pseudouridine1911/1915/1917 synthase